LINPPPTEEALAWPPAGHTEYRSAENRRLFEDCIGPVFVAPAGPHGTRAFALGPQSQLENLHGVIHGGALITVVDTMMGSLLKEAIGGQLCATISLTADFVGPAHAGDILKGEATLLRIGKRVAFTQAQIRCGDRLILTRSAKWAIQRP